MGCSRKHGRTAVCIGTMYIWGLCLYEHGTCAILKWHLRIRAKRFPTRGKACDVVSREAGAGDACKPFRSNISSGKYGRWPAAAHKIDNVDAYHVEAQHCEDFLNRLVYRSLTNGPVDTNHVKETSSPSRASNLKTECATQTVWSRWRGEPWWTVFSFEGVRGDNQWFGITLCIAPNSDSYTDLPPHWESAKSIRLPPRQCQLWAGTFLPDNILEDQRSRK
jgi:hypothetical protein